jgi:hypothetical protein
MNAMTPLPSALRRHVALRGTQQPPEDRPVSVGDVRRAASGGEERLVVVLAVNPERENVQVTLVHPYAEWATSGDVVVEPAASGVRYPLVVQATMRAVVWAGDLGPLVADVPAEVVAICLAPAMRPPEGVDLSSGPRLTGQLDARWDFKMSELGSLSRLSADCTAAALRNTEGNDAHPSCG